MTIATRIAIMNAGVIQQFDTPDAVYGRPATAEAGPGVYNRFYGPEVDPTVFDDPALKNAIDWVRKFSQQVDAGSQNRVCNDTTNLVITGKALLQLHGDWMKGECRQCRQGRGQGFRLYQHPWRQGAPGHRGRLDLPRWSGVR